MADGLKATEVPDWVPLTDSMSNDQAIDFVKQANGEDLHYIDTHSSTVDKLSTVISDPETQLGLLSGAVAVKDLTAVLSNGAKNLFGNAEKVVVSEASTVASSSAEVGEGTVLADTGTMRLESVVPNTSPSHQLLMQEGGSVSGLRFPKSDGLGSHASIDELLTSGARPGEVGVTVTDRTVRLGDVFDLSQRSGVEFSLVTDKVDGTLVKRLYSGDAFTSPVPRDSRLIGHAHPNEGTMQQLPSRADFNIVNDRYFEQLLQNPSAKPQPSRILWGTGDYDNTLFYPGLGKSYNLVETPKGTKVVYD